MIRFEELADIIKTINNSKKIKDIPYNGNCPWKKKLMNFANLEVFTNVFLHFLSQPEFLYIRLPES